MPKTTSEICKAYCGRKGDAIKEKEKQRSMARRLKMSAEQKEKQKTLAKMRMAKMRAAKKLALSNNATPAHAPPVYLRKSSETRATLK